jgi:glutathione S-transferase
MKPELISFKRCPFVQRSVIMLIEKGIDFDITYIDINEPPDWFREISPFGKVPVLRCGDTVLFESAVINEYLDETHPPPLHPADPLLRAKNRAWIEFGSSLNLEVLGTMMAKDQAAFDDKREQASQSLARVEKEMGDGPYFNGTEFSLVDAAYAPTLQRIAILREHFQVDLLQDLPRLRQWWATLARRDSVQRSAPADLAQIYRDAIHKTGSYLAGPH